MATQEGTSHCVEVTGNQNVTHSLLTLLVALIKEEWVFYTLKQTNNKNKNPRVCICAMRFTVRIGWGTASNFRIFF